MSVSPIAKGLPTVIASGIGRVVTRWAYQDWLINHIAYDVLGITIKQGRIAIRLKQPGQTFQMIKDLLVLRGLHVPALFGDLLSRIESVKERRDLLAHGVWMKTPRGLAVQNTRGSWEPTKDKIRITRRMAPAAQLIDVEYLKTLRTDLEDTIRRTQELRGTMNALLASLDKQQKQPASANPRAHT